MEWWSGEHDIRNAETGAGVPVNYLEAELIFALLLSSCLKTNFGARNWLDIPESAQSVQELSCLFKRQFY
tara:strand:+ start:178 stop:387 length:210 start_codon:yes stop_codon:yes gene_type:complete